MDILIEIVLEVFLEFFVEGSVFVMVNRKNSGWVRVPLFILVVFLYAVVIGMLVYLAVQLKEESVVLSFLFIVLALLVLIACIRGYLKVKAEVNQ